MNAIAEQHRKELIKILQMAYSGERAAALAYAGHWRSVRNTDERKAIAQIESDEWEHRRLVALMLEKLGAGPQSWRDLLMGSIGSLIFIACFLSGWFLPMYFAGLLEHSNVHEYADAAEHARALGLLEIERELVRLSVVEKAHEDYFIERVSGHCLTPIMMRLFGWGPLKQLKDSFN